MRILFLDHPQFTSGSYLLWHGLNEILPGSVVAYPHIPTHYDAEHFDLRTTPWFARMETLVARKELPPGVPAFATGEGLTNGGQMEIRRYGLGRRFPAPPEPPDEERVVRDLDAGRFDLVVLGNSHRVPTIALGRLVERVRAMPAVVYYDAGERDELNEHWVHVFRPRLVFKQILTPEVLARGLSVRIPDYSLRMYPLPLSSPIADNDSIMIGNLPARYPRESDGPGYKMLDIYYTMGQTWPGRKPLVDMLDTLCRTKGVVSFGWTIYENYHLVLSRSRMAVTMRGSGRDTQRYWEIPLYRTLMLSDGTMGCIHPHPFEDGKTAVFYRSLDDLACKIERFLPRAGKAEEERDNLASNGRHHLRRYHTTAARAVFFLERVHEVLGVSVSPAQESYVAGWKEAHGWNPAWQGPAADSEIA